MAPRTSEFSNVGFVLRLDLDQKNSMFWYHMLKVHKREKFFSSDFEFFTILYLVKLKY